LAVAYGSLSNSGLHQFTCATTEAQRNALTPGEAVSLTYKAIYAFYSIIIALTFAYQAYIIIALLRGHGPSEHSSHGRVEKLKNRLAQTFMVTSVITVAALLIQAALAIYTTVNDLDNKTKLAFIITIELFPSYCLAYLFRFGSPRNLHKKWKMSRSPTPETPSAPSQPTN